MQNVERIIMVSCVVRSAGCVRLKDGRLHVHQRGGFPDLLDGPDYIVVSRRLAEALRESCGGSVDITAAQVLNVATGEVLTQDHFEVRPREEITPETIATADATGRRAWHFRKSQLFVTQEVVDDLQRAGFDSLQFDPGFRAFVGLN